MSDDWEFFPIEEDKLTVGEWLWLVVLGSIWLLTLALFALMLAGAVFLA